MRILMGIRYLWRGGGTETHIITLANDLRKMGHVVAIYTGGGPWVSKARGLGIRVFVDPGLGGARPGRRRAVLNHLLQSERFHVLHAHDATCLRAFAKAAGTPWRAKVIFTVHGPYVRPVTLMHAKNKANAIIIVSQNIKASLPRMIPRGKVFTVANGIQTDVFRPAPGLAFRHRYGIPPNAFVVGYCGRFTFDKIGLGKRVARALQQVTSRQPGVYGIIAGRGSKGFFTSSNKLKVLGHIDQMPSFFNACDVIIGAGRTAMEALFCEVPVIAIGKAGYRGLVISNNVDRMIRNNFGDHGPAVSWTPATLHRALSAVRMNKEQYRRQSKFIRHAMVPKLSARRAAERTLAIYRSV